jgi:hypothetical protein
MRRRLVMAAIAVASVAALTVAGLAAVSVYRAPAPPAPPAPPTSAGASSAAPPATASPTSPPRLGWLSGASSDESADGRYGAWRGTPIGIGGTWDNGDAQQVEMYSLCKGAWTTWNKPLDVAIGAIDASRGETWAAAAKGAYVARWTRNLERVKECWGARDPALLYIRFAHEMNLASIDWHVRGGEEAEFVKAVTIYSDLRYQILPGAKIVLCPNDGTDPALGGLDIRKLWPGKDAHGRPVADVYAVDSYNMHPHVTTRAEFLKKINEAYPNGVPLGIERHRQFAVHVGVPFAIGEWSNNGDPNNAGGGGESPVYVQEFYRWAVSHAGDVDHPVPGQLRYEIHFNLWGQYAFWPRTDQPRTAEAYRALKWGTLPA